MDSEHESKDKSSLSLRWQELPRLKRRLVIATVVAIDAILGLLFQSGIGNGIDAILLGNLPNDMVWLSQSIQLISMGFLLVKVVFDDVQHGWFRTVLMAFSPLFLLFVVLFTIELLMIGKNVQNQITLIALFQMFKIQDLFQVGLMRIQMRRMRTSFMMKQLIL